ARPLKRMDCCAAVEGKTPSGTSSSLARDEVASQRNTVRPLRHGSQPVQRSIPYRLVHLSMRGIPPKYLAVRVAEARSQSSTVLGGHWGKPLTLTLSQREGATLSCRPSADAVAGGGNMMSVG